MSLILKDGDVFLSDAEGLIVTVDGDHPKMMGGVANQLLGKIGEDRDLFLRKLPFPLAMGSVHHSELEDPVGSFRHIFLMAVLDHVRPTPKDARPATVYTALTRALSLAQHCGLKKVASALMTCGWRIEPREAQRLMEAAARSVPGIDLELRLGLRAR